MNKQAKDTTAMTSFAPKPQKGCNVVAITGGAGFIGSQLGYNLHKAGWDVILIDDMSYGHEDNLEIEGEKFGRFELCDVRSPKMFDLLVGVHVVVHFAGMAPLPDNQGNPMKCMDVNVAGLANTLEAARKNSVKRIVFSSTSATYENNKVTMENPSQESNPISPYLLYAVSKQQGELLCRSFGICYGMEIAVVRFFNVYGPHQDFKRKHPPFLGYTIRELMEGNTPTFFNDGTQQRDYVFIDDVCALVSQCMVDKRAVGGTFNAASGRAYSVNELFGLICKIMNKEGIVPNYNTSSAFWDKYPNLFEGTYPLKKDLVEKEVKKFALGDYSHSESLLGWTPKVSIEKGLERTIEYCVNHHNT
jgi:nucleoside-diphosphate-sugar epimerase